MDWHRFQKEANTDPVLAQQGAGSSFRLLLKRGDDEHVIEVREGGVARVHAGPFVMPQCDFALAGSRTAWARFACPQPAPGDQDLFAFFRSGEITLTGDTRKFYAHLMCLKLVLGHLQFEP